MAGQDVPMRIGQGVDTHAFASVGGPLMLGGVEIPEGPALAGHSDADALLHAIADALLGACALGDLGSRFGTDEPAYAGAASAVFVSQALTWAGEAGWRVGNLDCTLVAQRPRLSAHLPAMRARIAELLGVDEAAVSVKATTTDGLGFAGRGEGLTALATVLVVPAGPAVSAPVG